MADIFLSYSRKDVAFARELAAALAARGWSVWWDRNIPAGRAFDEVIAEALAGARCVIVIWSADSIASDWVREEADEGRRRDILIPVLIDDVRPPLGFGRIHAADLLGWDGHHRSEPFDRLVDDIAALLGPPPSQHVVEPAAAVTPAAVSRATPLATDVVATVTAAPPHSPRQRPAADVLRRLRAVLARRWKPLTAAIAALVVVSVIYRFAGGGDGAQPRPIRTEAAEPALRLDAVLTETGEPIASGVAYQVAETYQDGEGTRKRVTGSNQFEGPPRFALTPRRYFVTASYGSASASTEVEVEEGTLTRQTLNLRAGIVRPTVMLADNGEPLPVGVSYVVADAAADVEGNRKRITGSGIYDGPPRFVLPAGRYLVTVTHGSASRSVEVDVAAGENKALPVVLQAGILSLSSQLAKGTPVLASGVSYTVSEAAADVEGKRKRIASSGMYDGPPRLPVPAGRYLVTAEHGSATASTEITVRAGEILPIVLDLRAGVLAVQAIAPGAADPLETGVSYQVYKAERDAEGRRATVVASGRYDGPPRFPVPAGRYYVTASADAGKAEAEVTLGAGEERPLRLRLRP